jgi:hypothetical protein
MLHTLLNTIRENYYVSLSICILFYYSLEPIERVVIDYNRFIVVNKVDSLIKHNNQLRESNKMLQSYSDSLLLCNNELLIENNKLLQEINTKEESSYKLLFFVSAVIFSLFYILIYKLYAR